MTTNLFIRKKEILLFSSKGESNCTCQLKNFIHCLNHFEKKRPLRFAYAESHTLMLNNLSIKENILLDGVYNSLSTTKEFQLVKHLDKEGRPALVKLFNLIGDLDLKPLDVSSETRKIVSLIKTFLKPSDYIFLENPEVHLGEYSLKLFIEALKEQVEMKEQTIFIYSQEEEIWLEHVNKKIVKESDGIIKVLLPSSFKKNQENKAA